MKKLLFSLSLFALTISIQAQEYDFQTIIDLDATPVISQGNTGTCWSFSTSSFLESEIIRKTGKFIDISEMYTVRNVYPKKIDNYITRKGKTQFGEGGLAHDVINSIKEYGIVPNDVFSPEQTKQEYDHSELFRVLKSTLDAYTSSRNTISNNWKPITEFILDTYIGKNITEFTYEGKKYTPQTFMDMLGIKADDYITITSFKNQTYYTPFILNIPDNFSNGSLYNLPLDEYIANIDNALDKGYTLSLDCDVSEITFNAKNGIAFIPSSKDDNSKGLTEIVEEKTITEESRLQDFYSYQTQDDHLMHIIGKVKDQKGNIYYKVKNSWGNNTERIGNDGYIYMSTAYMKLKSISVLLHKEALQKQTLKNLNIK
ncbi:MULTISPECIES: C1 family peptidase [Myroides]|uniref:C1 family peptidase n=1 Tax=Myroides TaxID=76831 RepID=UPI001328D303|nr:MULTISPECIES: C1 family peptidase [Myroides]MVX34945.1 aminopeptidase [Myroides sp. LoEW2-1]UVD79534.1 aminopeptidase [Myroides albus]